MKQSDSITIGLGDGAATIYETSNCAVRNPIPRLTLMMPRCDGYDQEPAIPAHSMVLYNDSVRRLYDMLHAYYNQQPTT